MKKRTTNEIKTAKRIDNQELASFIGRRSSQTISPRPSRTNPEALRESFRKQGKAPSNFLSASPRLGGEL